MKLHNTKLWWPYTPTKLERAMKLQSRAEIDEPPGNCFTACPSASGFRTCWIGSLYVYFSLVSASCLLLLTGIAFLKLLRLLGIAILLLGLRVLSLEYPLYLCSCGILRSFFTRRLLYLILWQGVLSYFFAFVHCKG